MSTETGYAAFLRDLPKDWQTAPLSAVAKVVGGGTPSRDVPGFWGGDVPWITPGEVSSERSAYLSETRERISTLGLAGSGATLLPPGSLMITTRATLGARAINSVPMTTNQGFKSLVFANDTDAPFFYYLTDKLKSELKRRASGTTFLEISGAEFGGIEVPVPPMGERQLIAEILDTLDTTIRQTEAIIEKLKQVKLGLLHDLLTRGIDANGELRPPQSQAPHLYQDSPLGWIPREWTPVQLGQLASLQRGHDIVATNFMQGPYPVISSSGVIGYHSVATSRGPNVIVGRKGSIGTVHFVETDFWAHDTSLFVTNFFGNDERFVYYLFDHLELGRYGTKSGSPSLNRNDIHPLVVGKPTPTEQERIVRVVAAHEAVQRASGVELCKLRQLKSGLMDDLLTGRVRVTPPLDQEAS